MIIGIKLADTDDFYSDEDDVVNSDINTQKILETNEKNLIFIKNIKKYI